MAEIINLGRARKAKAKADERAQADENAVKFGRTKAQKTQEAAEAARARAELSGKERESEPDRE
jgi:Domain of unknown function (DUF4169)